MTATDTQDKDTQIPTNLRLLLILEEVARRGVAVKPADLIEALGLAKPLQAPLTTAQIRSEAEEVRAMYQKAIDLDHRDAPQLLDDFNEVMAEFGY